VQWCTFWGEYTPKTCPVRAKALPLPKQPQPLLLLLLPLLLLLWANSK
jgi:hypothetical protein